METILGFDLRSTGLDPEWTAERRTRHLLRRDVTAVRSVDPHVWVRPPGFPRAPEPSGLWRNLPNLVAVTQALGHDDVMTVRITAFEEDEEDDGQTAQDADPTEPPSDSHELLGYDVADYDLLAGLANCGYTSEEAASLAPAWAPLLNEWHLFGNLEDATSFAEVTARRVPEHAPFYVYGIYRLD